MARKSSPVRVIHSDGTEEVRSNSSFHKPKVKNGKCTRCGAPVRWRKQGKKHTLLDRGGYEGQEHACLLRLSVQRETGSEDTPS